MQNQKSLAWVGGLIAGLIILILAAFVIWGGKKPNSNVINNQQVSSLTQSAARNTAPTSQTGQQSGYLSAQDAYLAYKKDLATKTTSGADIFALSQKYRPAIIIQGWEAAGGVSKVFPAGNSVCAFLNTFKNIYPEYPLVKVDGAERLNSTTVILHTSAGAGQRGEITMNLESDGWKVSQESWPDWPGRFVPCPD